MNTRLQVEHPVTEMVTGVDLVHWQLRLARGERLTVDPERALEARGHAIECRIYAEDPDAGFLPSPGRILTLRSPAGPGVRDDCGVAALFEVPVYYDSMIAKLVAWGEDRPQAIGRMRRALSEYEVGGVKTTIPFFQWLLEEPAFVAGTIDTTFLDHALAARNGAPFTAVPAEAEEIAVVGAALHAYLKGEVGRGAAARRGDAGSLAWRRQARAEALRR